MNLVTRLRLERLTARLAPPDPEFHVQFVGADVGLIDTLTPDEQVRLVGILDQVNVHARTLIDQHGPAIERPHRFRNDALDCLGLGDVEWVADVLERCA